MSDKALAVPELDASTIEAVVIGGDLEKLTPAQRVSYYHSVCKSLGLNPLTQPFAYIRLNNKLTLYARRDATDQLRRRDGISITIVGREQIGDLYIVTARATTPDGRSDESTGAVAIKGLAGDALANACMKAETKAKRRVTLSICGLGWLDETEAGSVPETQVVSVNEAGEIVAPHWYDDMETQKRFWAWVGEMGFDEPQVLDALGVQRITDFKGTKAEAVALIRQYDEARRAKAASQQPALAEDAKANADW